MKLYILFAVLIMAMAVSAYRRSKDVDDELESIRKEQDSPMRVIHVLLEFPSKHHHGKHRQRSKKHHSKHHHKETEDATKASEDDQSPVIQELAATKTPIDSKQASDEFIDRFQSNKNKKPKLNSNSQGRLTKSKQKLISKSRPINSKDLNAEVSSKENHNVFVNAPDTKNALPVNIKSQPLKQKFNKDNMGNRQLLSSDVKPKTNNEDQNVNANADPQQASVSAPDQKVNADVKSRTVK